MWERIKELWADAFALCIAGWILFHLAMIAKYGTFTIGERLTWLVYVEIGLLVGLMVLYIERIIKDIKNE